MIISPMTIMKVANLRLPSVNSNCEFFCMGDVLLNFLEFLQLSMLNWGNFPIMCIVTLEYIQFASRRKIVSTYVAIT